MTQSGMARAWPQTSDIGELFDNLPPENSPGQRFRDFCAENPEIIQEARRIAVEKRRARQHIGMKAIFELIRWNPAFSTTGKKYKLNNDYTSLMARYLMDTTPELKGYFELRELQPKTKKMEVRK